MRKGQRVKRVTTEDIRTKREAILRKVDASSFSGARHEARDPIRKKEHALAAVTFTIASGATERERVNSETVSIVDELW